MNQHTSRHPLPHNRLGLLALLGALATAQADTIDTTGQAPYERCGYCHEYDGNAAMPGYPHLSGQRSEYMTKQLRDYRAGQRLGDMQGTAELLSDADIRAVVDYFTSQPRRPKALNAQPADSMAQARQLFRNGDTQRGITPCVSCHGPDGAGQGRFPGLAGLDPTYLKQQLLAFKRSERRNDLGGLMRTVAQKLDVTEINQLAEMLARLGSGVSG